MEKAAYFYAQALLQFHYIVPDNKEEGDIVDPLYRDCHLNQALVFYKQDRLEEGLTECYQALKLDPGNLKGLYRKALILLKKQDFEESLEISKELL